MSTEVEVVSDAEDQEEREARARKHDAERHGEATYVIQLAVIAALIDGEVSDPEMETLNEQISEHFLMSKEDISKVAQDMIRVFKKYDIKTSPTAALLFSSKAFGNIRPFQRAAAFDIAEKVIISGGVDASERTFLSQLKQFSGV